MLHSRGKELTRPGAACFSDLNVSIQEPVSEYPTVEERRLYKQLRFLGSNNTQKKTLAADLLNAGMVILNLKDRLVERTLALPVKLIS